VTDRIYRICMFCLLTGAVLPWGLLIFAAGISLASTAEWASVLSAYSAALGLALLALSFLLARAQALGGIPGYRKLWLEASAAGYVCSKNRVQRLLQGAGYRSSVACRPGYRKLKPGMPVLPNLLNRAFSVAAPNRVWVSDITQIRCEEGWLYIAIILDLYSRQIVGWSAGGVNQAGGERKPQGEQLLFHSDQGSQYRSEEVMAWLTRRGVTLSMSRRGNCWDNACAESFFALLKKEWTHRLGVLSRAEMTAEVRYYAEEYYPILRRHGTLGGLTPRAFEATTA